MSKPAIQVSETRVRTDDGWSLHLKRTACPAQLDRATRPLLLVPGYGMNSFILGFHPRGTSMERCLAEAGFEVWTANLRGQGPSRAASPNALDPALRHFADYDLPPLIDRVLRRTTLDATAVDLIGCSLGGSISYAYLALRGSDRVGSLVAIGAPLHWTWIHPVIKTAFSSPSLAGALRLRGTRPLARIALPILAQIRPLISIYMNPDLVDLSATSELVKTVENPHPRVNRDIALWLRARDMVLRGVNVTEQMTQQELPLLIVLANADGIVPPGPALHAGEVWGGPDVDVLEIGTEDEPHAHADLFISHEAPSRVFAPIASWLRTRALQE